MKKSLALAIAAAGIAMFTAQAAMAHGCHRSCEEGKYGWHRHVGNSCQRVVCERPRMHHHRKPVCVQKCKWIGPFKQCKTVCN